MKSRTDRKWLRQVASLTLMGCCLAILGCDSKETRAQAEYAQAIERINAGDQAGSIVHLDQALEYQPDFAEAYFRRGLVRLAQRQTAMALADFDEAIKRKPGSAAYVLGRGSVLLSDGQYEAALKDLTQVKQLHPSANVLARADEVANLAVRAKAVNAITPQSVSTAAEPSSSSVKRNSPWIRNGILGRSPFFARHPVWSILLFVVGHWCTVHLLVVLTLVAIRGRERRLTDTEQGAVALLSLGLGGCMFFLTWGFHHWIWGTLCVVWSLAIGANAVQNNSKK